MTPACPPLCRWLWEAARWFGQLVMNECIWWADCYRSTLIEGSAQRANAVIESLGGDVGSQARLLLTRLEPTTVSGHFLGFIEPPKGHLSLVYWRAQWHEVYRFFLNSFIHFKSAFMGARGVGLLDEHKRHIQYQTQHVTG